MKKLIQFLAVPAILFAIWSGAKAAPVEIDTESAHIILVRPIDLWSGDTKRLDNMSEAFLKHWAGFNLRISDHKLIIAAPGLFGSFSDDPIVHEVQDDLKGKGFTLKGNQANMFTVLAPVNLTPDEAQKMRILQSRLFSAAVVAAGDPRRLEGKALGQKVLGNILALLTLGAPLAKAGSVAATGAKIWVESFSPDQAIALPKDVWNVVTPIDIPAMDFTPYRSVDIMKIQASPDIIGQLIIAYKGEHTQEAENEAMVKAIVSLTGADTTLPAIQQARSDDLARRQSIWDACVAEGRPECPKDDATSLPSRSK